MDGWMELSITNLAARPNAGSATCDFNGIISEQFPGLLCMFHDNNYTTVFSVILHGYKQAANIDHNGVSGNALN